MIKRLEYIVLSFFLTRALFLGGCFSLLVNVSGNSMIISGILGMLFGYFFLYLLYKRCGYVSNIVKLMIVFIILLVNTLSSTMLTSNYLLVSTPTIMILSLMYLTLLYGNSKGIEVIGRLAFICFLVSFILYILGYIGVLPNIKICNMLPIIDSKVTDVIKGIIVFISASILPNILLIEYNDNLRFKDVSIGYIIGSISIIIIMFFILTIYGSELASIARFPEYLILKKVNILSYITNLENVLVMEWIVNIIICLLFSIKVLNNMFNKYVVYGMLLIMLFICEMFLFKNYVYVLFIKNYVYYGMFTLIILSLIFRNKKDSTL